MAGLCVTFNLTTSQVLTISYVPFNTSTSRRENLMSGSKLVAPSYTSSRHDSRVARLTLYLLFDIGHSFLHKRFSTNFCTSSCVWFFSGDDLISNKYGQLRLGLIIIKKVIPSDERSDTIRWCREAWLNLAPSLTRISGDMKTAVLFPKSVSLQMTARNMKWAAIWYSLNKE